MNKTFILLVVAMLTASVLSAQTRQLQIRGEASIQVAPDLGILNIQLNAHGMEFSKAISGLSALEKDVLKKLEKIGYKREQVKTADFSVYENRVWYEGRSYDSGYVARQSMSLEFANTKEKIGEILNTFATEDTNMELSFTFGLSQSLEQAKSDEVIALAVKDAKRNADLIAAASGVSLGHVLRIDYHVDASVFSPRDEMYRMDAKMTGSSEGFEAKALTVSDGVVITYEIE